MIKGFGYEVEVYRNDVISLSDIEKLRPGKIVISPGPCTPDEAGISIDLIREFGERIPILGVCLGHQCIAAAYGAKIVYAGEIVHGKTSMINHNNSNLFKGLKNPFEATRYHSLIIDKNTFPEELEVIAESNQIIMGIKHKERPIFGVQFHPESIKTQDGLKIIENFLNS